MATDDNIGDIITVQAFAYRFRVDASIVRRWAKQGRIDYVLEGPRKLRRVRVSDIVKLIQAAAPAPLDTNRTALKARLMALEVDETTAMDIITGSDDESVAKMLMEAPNGEQKVESENHSLGQASFGAGAVNHSSDGRSGGNTKRDKKLARQAKARS